MYMEKVVSLCRLTISQGRGVKDMKKFIYASIWIWVGVGLSLLAMLGIALIWSVLDVIG